MYDQQPVSQRNEDLDVTTDEPIGECDARVEEASSKYLASWNHLISTTNWEKGRIISEWRDALRGVEAPASEYSDEAWSRRVGNVTPQHVGRLRRVYSRFHKTHKQYKGLYWSHFQAALDWDDAEMWLEGAVQSNWSVSAMRESRWEAVGAPADQKPRDEDVILAELDEDVRATDDASFSSLTDDRAEVAAVDRDDDDAADADLDAAGSAAAATGSPACEPPAAPVRPFEDLPELPPDVHEAFEAMKLAIINHKMSGWRDISCDDLLAALNSLKQLALAPSEG
ncbi:MAG: hypothetical protein GX621_10910 [Pirellulaceae bacterium]|nr:hypothetical protein [Pirellulaceae bacterium]